MAAAEINVRAADASVISKLSDLDRSELAVVERYAAEDRYISADELPWFPFAGTFEIKLYRMDNRNGVYVIALKSSVDAVVGKHRHRGPVAGVTISGRWGYHEYDWEAGPGDYVRENPGTIHTLYMRAGTEVLFTIEGAIEFLNDDDTLAVTMDGWSFTNMYLDYCKEKGLPVNERIFF